MKHVNVYICRDLLGAGTSATIAADEARVDDAKKIELCFESYGARSTMSCFIKDKQAQEQGNYSINEKEQEDNGHMHNYCCSCFGSYVVTMHIETKGSLDLLRVPCIQPSCTNVLALSDVEGNLNCYKLFAVKEEGEERARDEETAAVGGARAFCQCGEVAVVL